MNYNSITRIYGKTSKVYDAIFKWFFFPRIKHAIPRMDITPEDKILDVGIGTGLSIPFYPVYCTVTGIDISVKMMGEARKKIERGGIKHVRLMEMDAQHLAFPDNSFDKVFISHVVSVVPDPYRMMDEVRRVCKKGGKVVIINHFRSKNRVLAKLDNLMTPFCEKIGWRSNLDMDEFIDYSGLNVDREYRLNRLDFWNIIFARV